jgi:hypothetical protein
LAFDFGQPLLIAGVLLGLASSMHCLGMCSGIATSLNLLAQSASGSWSRNPYARNLLINAGRITGYVVAGAVVGGLGASVFGALDRSLANIVLRWAAAVSLGWIGLSMLGFAPLPSALYRLGGVVSDGLGKAASLVWLPPALALFLAGCVWGFFPCAMVYAALFYAMLSGTWFNGIVVMFGFGLGTLLPVMAAGLGLPLLREKVQSARLRTMIGVAIVLLGIVSVIVPTATLAELCGLG